MRSGWFALGALVFLLSVVPIRSWSAEDGVADRPEAEDFTGTPWTDYAEFGNDADEAEDLKFFQYGRFFGISLGGGYHHATGNRGLLYEGGFPAIDLKLHAWLNLDFALNISFFTVGHDYTEGTESKRARITRIGIDLKWYIPTRNLTSAISFAHPNLVIGFGSFSKVDSNEDSDAIVQDDTIGLTVGTGLEFAIDPGSAYFGIDGRLHFVEYDDTQSSKYQSQGIDDLSGIFYSITGNFLFTW